MASTGKKGKKSKWIPASITDIIAEPTTVPAAQNWADATEDEVDTSFGAYSSRGPSAPVVLPSASRAVRGGLTVDDESIPRRPPYSAYICNLPYDVDKEAILELFAGQKIQNLRLPRDGDKLKGYGYVDFEDRESLVDAMNIIDPTISGRKIRIDVSTQDNERRMGMSRGGGRMGDRERDYDPERTQGDWRSGPRVEAEAPPRSRGMDRERPRERERDGSAEMRPGAWRDGDRPAPEPPRSAYGGRDSYGRDRGGGGFEDRDRYRDGDRERGYGRDGFRDDRGFNREGGFRPAADRDRYRDGDRGGSRGFGERRGFGDRDRERDPPREESKPRERPKLNLLPRTVPLDPPAPAAPADDDKPDEPRAPRPTAAQLFGGAKPVDTSAKEREIEERLKKQEEEARQRTEESQRWGRRGDGPADSKGPPKRNDDRGRESRSYGDNRERRDDRRDYSRDTRDYSRDNRDKEDRRDYSRDNDRRDYDGGRASRDVRRDYSRDKDDRRDNPRDKDDRRDYPRDKDDRQEYPRDKDETRDNSRGRDGDYSRDKGDRRDSSRDGDDGRDPSPAKKQDDPRDAEDKRDSSVDKERRDKSQDNGRKGNGERHARSKDRDDEIIMPQLKQKEAPNFVGTNKFSCLEDAEADASD